MTHQSRLLQLGRGSKNLVTLMRSETFAVLPPSDSESNLSGVTAATSASHSHQALARLEEVPPWLRPVFQRIQSKDPTLTKVAFEESCLRSCEVSSLFGAVAAHSGIVKIRFSNKGFQDPRTGIVEFTNCLEDMASLCILELRNNSLSLLPNNFGACLSRLTELHLDHNELTALPLSISSITPLRVLNVAKNKLTSLPAAYSRLVQLQHIDISSNRFTCLPGWLTALPVLTDLKIKGNRLKNKPKQIDVTADIMKWIEDTQTADLLDIEAGKHAKKKKSGGSMGINLNRRSTTVTGSGTFSSPRRQTIMAGLVMSTQTSSPPGSPSSSSSSSSITSSPSFPGISSPFPSGSSDDLTASRAPIPRFVCRLLSARINRNIANVNPFVTFIYLDDFGDVRRTGLKLNDSNPFWADGEAAFMFYEPEDHDQPLIVSLYSRDFDANADIFLGSTKVSATQLTTEGLFTLKMKDQSVVQIVVERGSWRNDEAQPFVMTFEQPYSLSQHMCTNIATISCDQVIHLLFTLPDTLEFLQPAFLCLHTCMPPLSFVTTLTAAQDSLEYAGSLPVFLNCIFQESFKPYLDVFLSHCDDSCISRFVFFLQNLNISQDSTFPKEKIAAWAAQLTAPQPGALPTPSQGEFEPFLMETNVRALADQMTLIELEQLGNVKLCEILPFVKGDLKRAPNLTLVTERFNLTTYWLISEIVTATRLKDRVAVITTCIQLGREFLKLGNLQGVFEVVCALNSAPVSRMKRTWAEIDRQSREEFNSLEALATPSDNYKNYRMYVQALQQCIPYIGVVISDLTFILDGNPDRIGGMINWCKCRMISEAVSLVGTKIKNMSVPNQNDPAVFDLRCRASRLCTLSENRCYQLSLRIDPRGTYEDSLVELINEEKRLLQEIARLRARVAAVGRLSESHQSPDRSNRLSFKTSELRQRASSLCKAEGLNLLELSSEGQTTPEPSNPPAL